MTNGDQFVILSIMEAFGIPVNVTPFRLYAAGRKFYFSPEGELYKIADFLKGELYTETETFPISEKMVEDYKKNIRRKLR